MTPYYQILFEKENIKLNQSQLTISQNILNNTNELIKEGEKPKGEIFELQARLEKDNKNLIDAQNNYKLSKLKLKHLLNLDKQINIKKANLPIEEKDFLNFSKQNIINFREKNDPYILSNNVFNKITKNNISTIKTGYYPSLTLQASLSSNYYKYFENNIYSDFGNQIENNFAKYIGLKLQIPIIY